MLSLQWEDLLNILVCVELCRTCQYIYFFGRALFAFPYTRDLFLFSFGPYPCREPCFPPTCVSALKPCTVNGESPSPPTEDILPSVSLSSSCLHFIFIRHRKDNPEENGKKSSDDNATHRTSTESHKQATTSSQTAAQITAAL